MPTYPTYKLGDLILDAIGGDWGKDPGFQDETYELAYCIRGAEYKNWADDNGSTAVLRKIKCGNLLKRQLKEFDIIVEISGGGPEQPVGRTEVITKRVLANFKGSKVLCTNFLRLIRPNAELVDAVFLNYYLKFFYSTGEIIKYQAGSNNLRNLKFKDYLNLPIPLPPLATQRAIVTRIETLFAELDKGVEKLKTAQQQLKVYRQAVLNDCLTKGSEKWEKVKLGEVIERIEAGKSFRCSEKVPSKNEKGIVKISAVTWGEFLEMECKTIVNEEFYNPNYRIHKGDLLISRANTLQLVGSCVFVRKEPNRDIVLSDKVLRLIPKQNADSRFLLYSLRTSNSRKQIQTMSTGNQDSMRNIGQDRLKKINLECPSLSEQQRIVQEIETRLSQAELVEASVEQSLQQAEALRQSILKKAFSGELVKK